MTLCITIAIWPLPAGASLHGTSVDAHLWLNLWVALGLLALAHGLLIVGLASKRRARGEELPAALNDKGAEDRAWLWRTEYIPLAAFALVLALLGFRAEQLWAASRYTGADPAAMQIEVTGVQFAWYFRYPGRDAVFGTTQPRLVAPGEGNPLGLDPRDPHGADDFVSSELVLPVGREVDLRLRAQDVIHGFSVPEMRLKQNAVPGETAHVHFTPTATGTYAVLCTQVCGLGHYRMSASVRVLPAEEFDAWLAERERKAAQR